MDGDNCSCLRCMSMAKPTVDVHTPTHTLLDHTMTLHLNTVSYPYPIHNPVGKIVDQKKNTGNRDEVNPGATCSSSAQTCASTVIGFRLAPQWPCLLRSGTTIAPTDRCCLMCTHSRHTSCLGQCSDHRGI